MKYYFDGTKIVEVVFDRRVDEDAYTHRWADDLRTLGYYYKNVNTGCTYYIDKSRESLEIFDDRNELIEFKIKEFEDEVTRLNKKILLLKK